MILRIKSYNMVSWKGKKYLKMVTVEKTNKNMTAKWARNSVEPLTVGH